MKMKKDNEHENDNNIIKKLNDSLDEIIDKSKSFEGQIESIRKVENLDEYRFMDDYGDKELKFKIFKLEIAHLLNIIAKKIFEQIFGHTFEKLANTLINATKKEENQIIVNNINENKEKLCEEDETSDCYDYVIQTSDWRNNLINVINVILDFSKPIQLDLTWRYKNQRIKKWASDFIWWIQSILLSTLRHQKTFFFLCMYIMYLIWAEGYEKANVDFLTIKTTSEI